MGFELPLSKEFAVTRVGEVREMCGHFVTAAWGRSEHSLRSHGNLGSVSQACLSPWSGGLISTFPIVFI